MLEDDSLQLVNIKMEFCSFLARYELFSTHVVLRQTAKMTYNLFRNKKYATYGPILTNFPPYMMM